MVDYDNISTTMTMRMMQTMMRSTRVLDMMTIPMNGDGNAYGDDGNGDACTGAMRMAMGLS